MTAFWIIICSLGAIFIYFLIFYFKKSVKKYKEDREAYDRLLKTETTPDRKVRALKTIVWLIVFVTLGILVSLRINGKELPEPLKSITNIFF